MNFGNRAGQSLMEVLVGLSIGIVLIAAAAFAISGVLRSQAVLQKSEGAAAAGQGFLRRLAVLAPADWASFSSLSRGSSTAYYLVASGTSLSPVAGVEGVFDSDIVEGMLGRWGFDEASGVVAYDLSGSGFAGTLWGGVTRQSDTSCVAGGCVNFDGIDDYVDMGNQTAFNFGNSPFTLSVWFNNSAPSGYDMIMGKGGFWANNEYQLYTSSGNLYFYVDKGGVKYFASAPIVAGERYHAAGVYDGSAIELFVNGNSAMRTPVDNLALTNASAFRVGKASSDQFIGNIDEVRVYTRALTAVEIQRLYGATAFSRKFFLENACRSTDASSTLTVAPCSGGSAPDPSALYATVWVGWGTGAAAGSFSASTFLARAGNEVFRQTDWSGGAAGSAILTESSAIFATSSNVDITNGGSIRIHGM